MSDAGSSGDTEAGGREARVDRLRLLAERIVGRVGGMPAVRTLLATLEVYDRGGGGLVAGGLAYSALIALIPGMLLIAATIGFLVDDPAVQEQIVDWIATTVPPLAEVARIALEAVSAGALPTSIIALIGLLWGSSRFYAALDNAFSRIFRGSPRRNEIERTVRGLIVTILFVAVPIAALVAGSAASWLLDLAPGETQLSGVTRTLLQLASPIGSFVLFVGVVSLVYRFVPAERVSMRALLPAAILVGIVLAGFTQLFTFIAPRLVGWARLYGAFVTVFALLAWLAIGFNMLLLGAAWTRVRALARSHPEAASADPAEHGHLRHG
jgi:membrane protein